MIRIVLATLCCFALLAGTSFGDDPGKAVKAQMVKGTIKVADPEKNLLIVDQKVKDETVQRELSITETTPFTINVGGEKKELAGKEALEFLKGKEGASVQVKCDKDVNVVSITVTVKK